MSVIVKKKRKRTLNRGRNRSTRPKTFSTEDAAKAYAEKEGIKEYSLSYLNEGTKKKIKVISK